jgi:hypothetical protein
LSICAVACRSGDRKSHLTRTNMRKGLLLIAALSMLSAPATSFAAGFGANESDPDGPRYEDYRRCYVLDVWRLSQLADQTSPEANAITEEGRTLGGLALQAGVTRGRSQGWVTGDLRTYSNTRTALYQSETAEGATANHAAEDLAFCQRRGLISRRTG